MKELVVLSLFDGLSGGRIALERAGFKVGKYFASEVDKYAIQVAMHNYPDIIQIGDVTKVSYKDGVLYTENGEFEVGEVDLVIGGSPCQGFSFAGKQLNFDDPRSALFFEFVRIKEECNPKFFMLENVNMKEEYREVISKYMGTEPIFINSRLFCPQDRKRLYWTNIDDIAQPEDKNVSWMDISVDGWFAGSMRGRRINKDGKRDDYNKEIPIVQHIESRLDNKTNCLTTVGKDNIASKTRVGRTPLNEVEWRYLYRSEMENLQTVPVGYTDCVSLNQATKLLGNGWNIDTVAHIFSFMHDKI